VQYLLRRKSTRMDQKRRSEGTSIKLHKSTCETLNASFIKLCSPIAYLRVNLSAYAYIVAAAAGSHGIETIRRATERFNGGRGGRCCSCRRFKNLNIMHFLYVFQLLLI
jgi:hypothetical protein